MSNIISLNAYRQSVGHIRVVYRQTIKKVSYGYIDRYYYDTEDYLVIDKFSGEQYLVKPLDIVQKFTRTPMKVGALWKS